MYRPVSGRWLSQGQSQHQESKSTPGVKVNTRRCLGEETPNASVAKKKRRQGKASPRWRRRPTRASPDQILLRQGNHSVVPRYPWVGKTMEGATPWEGLRSRWSGGVLKRRERWLQGHSNNTSVGQPDSWSTPAAPETPLGQIRLKRKVTPRVAGCRVREEGRYALKVSD